MGVRALVEARAFVPYVSDRDPRGERTTDVYSRLLEDRIVFIGAPIDDQLANTVMAQLLHLEGEDPGRDINVYINSPGGSVPAGLALHDTMRHVGCDVATTVIGMAASMAAVLLAAGARGKRHALPNSRILLHQPHVEQGPGGQVSDVEIHARELVQTRRRMNELLAGYTGQPYEKVERDTDRDHILGAEQAIEYGIIDRIIARTNKA
jgi:ATP-dependent Clp protease, protease subunit